MFVFSGETAIATAGALGGGVCVKLLDHYYQKKEERRKDARDNLQDIKKEIHDLREELDEWKDKYYRLFRENAILNARRVMLEMRLGDVDQAAIDDSAQLGLDFDKDRDSG